ncbi:MAG: hypothetical protein IIC51_04285 [Planctomycetes bacterium]|nr:hypothetical protein [Planctomycetota bacterium]
MVGAIRACTLTDAADNNVMYAKRLLGLFVMCVTFVELGGCATQTPTAANFAVRHFENGNRAGLLAAAAAAMEETGYQTSPGEPDAGRLVSIPRFNVAGDEPTGRASQISSKSLTRRIAEVRVEESGDRVSVFCRVLVQEQTTRAHRMLAFDQSGSDSPAITPIEREAATTERQNTVWQTIRRDRSTERRILAVIGERLANNKKP